MEVWERFLVAVDVVVLLDEHGAVEQRWPLLPGESLFDDLVLAGAPLAFDEDFRYLTGHADCFDLSLAPATAQVIAVTGEAPAQQVLLDEETADLVLGWYSINVDSCG